MMYGDFVLLPLGITLLSNIARRRLRHQQVLLPLGITLLSNRHRRQEHVHRVLLPLGITLLSNLKFQNKRVFCSEKWENSLFSYGLEQHSDTTTEYPAAAKRL